MSAPEGRPLVGDVVAGKYRIEGVAGEGGMGIVYEAEHVILRQRVAVKVLVPRGADAADAIDRFSFEASVIAGIQSEHVVRVMDAGSLPSGAPYLVMEFLEGCDLEELLARRGPLPPREVVDFALQALEALAHAHAARVIHRDLKPANLFLTQLGGGREVLKLLDFGISTSLDFAASAEGIAGSPLYMSPEQLRKAPLDHRTDLWSLGVVLYELLSGVPPFAGSLTELVHAIVERDPVPLHERRPAVGRGLSSVVARCLVRDRSARWPSTAALAEALAPFGSGAWTSALEGIERAAASSRRREAPRRFESFENALAALETSYQRDRDVETMAPPDEAFGATIPAPSLPEGGALRVLLIDDSQIALEIHAHALMAAGFSVRTTSSPTEFDALLASFRPHLVLMDLRMPAVPGDVLCRRVKARYGATLPVVFVSDQPPTVLAHRAKVGGADAFFAKTSDMAAFVAFVENICAMTYSPEHLPSGA